MTADGANYRESSVPANGMSWVTLMERAQQLRQQAAAACARSRELKERFEGLVRSQPPRLGANSAKPRWRSASKS